jgi:peptidoglycan/LPS O-acetylase OafA/YrhL
VTAQTSVPASGRIRALGYVPALDGLRGVAVLLVIATHSVLLFWPSHFDDVVPGGFLGVDLFFVLSGFLITSLLLGEQSASGRVSFPGFYRRRALRLLPALAVLLVAHLVYTAVTGLPLGIELRSMAVISLYVSNWYVVSGHTLAPGLQHMWSLSVEEQFYLVWPIVTVVVLGARRSLRFSVIFLSAAVLTAAAWRAVLAHGHTVTEAGRLGIRTDTRADALLLGALAAYLWTQGTVPRRWLAPAGCAAAAFLAACVLFVPPTNIFYDNGGYTLVAVAASIIVIGVADGSRAVTRSLGWGPLRSMGRVSYGLYLWHLPVFFAVARYATSWWAPVQLAFALMLTAAFTLASWKFVEVPCLQRKNRGRPRQLVGVAGSNATISTPSGTASQRDSSHETPARSSGQSGTSGYPDGRRERSATGSEAD